MFGYIVTKLKLEDSEENTIQKMKKKSYDFCQKVKKRWEKSRFVLNNFMRQNRDWLKGQISFEFLNESESSYNFVGRPQKSFQECSTKSQKRKLKSLLETNSPDELILAAQMSLQSQGRRDAAHILKEVVSNSPERATKIKKAFKNVNSKPLIKITPDEALAFFVDQKLTKDQYISIRQINKSHNADIYPNYHLLLEAKKLCYPDQITITEFSAEIQLQSLIDHTIKRLVFVQHEVLKQLKVGLDTSSHLSIIFKWGCDGASGQSQYKQRFSVEATENNCDDAYVFVMSLVPLQLFTNSSSGDGDTNDRNSKKIILWQNNRPSSTKYCRPIKILLKKETTELIKTEIENVENQISKLTETSIGIEGRQIFVKPILTLTMIDGKICSVIMKQSNQNCHICGATPKQMNDLKLQRPNAINKNAFSLGLSSLHAWIKCLECILHISYRLETKKWQIRKEDKEQVTVRKRVIQDRMRSDMGLLVDVPKPGFGTTNDGNTARRFFNNPKLAATITGIDEELITRFGVILKTISSGYNINITEFNTYCLDTANIYVQKYNWYYMPQSVHKLLIHGGDIISEALLPIGMLSEEVQEARNKDYKNYREHHTRKFSRSDTMSDLINLLLISSDPVISRIRLKRQKKNTSISPDVLRLLSIPEFDDDAYNSEED